MCVCVCVRVCVRARERVIVCVCVGPDGKAGQAAVPARPAHAPARHHRAGPASMSRPGTAPARPVSVRRVCVCGPAGKAEPAWPPQ